MKSPKMLSKANSSIKLKSSSPSQSNCTTTLKHKYFSKDLTSYDQTQPLNPHLLPHKPPKQSQLNKLRLNQRQRRENSQRRMLKYAKRLSLVKIITLSWGWKRISKRTILRKLSKRELSRSIQTKILTQKQLMRSKK
jgi:hypothetical protein